MKTFLLVLAIFLASNCLVKSEPFYKCVTNLPAGQCASKTDANAQVTYNLSACSEAGKVCPFKSVTTTTPVSCGPESVLPVYPGGVCTADTDCIAAATCVVDGTTKKCKAKKTICESHDDCNIGQICVVDGQAKACKNQVADDQPCTTADSYECENGSACFKVDETSSVCKKLFSVANGTKAPDALFPSLDTDNIVSFCESGFRDANGFCRKLTLKTTTACTADTDCKYDDNTSAQNGNEEFLQNGAEVTITGSCEAGYNPTGAKYCKSANSSTSLTDYITVFKTKVLVDNQGKCHTKERFNCKVVKENSTLLKDYQTKQVNALFEHKFKGADACVKSVLFPYFQVPVVNKCPKFECAAEAKETCGTATGKRFETRTVKINPCSANKSCTVLNSDFFDTDSDKTEQCNAAPAKVPTKLPGETCDGDDDCIEVTGYEDDKTTVKKYKKCNASKTCDGVEKGKRCLNNDSCKVGNYCLLDASATRDPLKDVCADQLDKSAVACKNTYDCKNGLICLSTKCVDPFSVDQGVSIDDVDATTKDYACATGYYALNDVSGKVECAQRFYGVEEKKRAAKGLVTCDYDTNCNYKVIFKAAKDAQPEVSKLTTRPCQCGYNKDGLGYCPYAEHEADNVKRFQNINNNVKSSLSNTLHTVHRFGGFTDAKKSPVCKSYWVNPMFRNSVSCAIDVLGKSATCEDVDVDKTSTDTETAADTSTKSNTMMLKFSSVIGLIIAIALF